MCGWDAAYLIVTGSATLRSTVCVLALVLVKVKGARKCFLSTRVLTSIKAQCVYVRVWGADALISILFLLKLTQCILESPACSVIVQWSTREKIEKWVTERERRAEWDRDGDDYGTGGFGFPQTSCWLKQIQQVVPHWMHWFLRDRQQQEHFPLFRFVGKKCNWIVFPYSSVAMKAASYATLYCLNINDVIS